MTQLLFSFFFVLTNQAELPIIKATIYSLISLFIIYLLVRFLTEKFIFRKIKLIYKVISDSKDSLKGVEDVMNSNTSFENVNDTVVQWAKTKENEISSLKSMENYRKEYLGDISHELKTPLFSIEGYLHTLIDGGVYDEKVNIHYLQRAISNVNRLRTIVDDLEMINQLESNLSTLDIQRFDIKELTEEVFKDLEIQAKTSHIQLTFKDGASKSFYVSADKEKIRQVFVNLISNSIKYGIEEGRTKVSFYDMDERILVEISDNGIGINQEDLKHVFDRFYRADKSRNRAIGGSGLGLSIVKHIIEVHKEKLTLRSTYGLGSTFGFTLKKG